MKKIKFSKHTIKNSDINLVSKIIRSGWLTHGKYTQLFEASFKKFTKSKYCITVSSCTAGLHLSCLSVGFKKGDEVIVPALSHTATAHAVEYTGARAVFADIEKLSGNLTLKTIKEKITKKTKGVIIVHMAGLACEVKKIANFCKARNLVLLEDCAHGLGTKFNKKHVGNFGASGSFSFYPTKQITTGEGGAVITNQKKIYDKIKKLKAFGIDKDVNERKKPGLYDVKDLGFNYRMTDFQAALGLKQMKNYNKNLKKRIIVAKRYIQNLSRIKEISFTPFSKNNSYFVFQIFLKKRDELLNFLSKKKIGTSIHYAVPLTKMSFYKKKYKIKSYLYKNSNEYSDTSISLPVYPSLKIKEVDFICKKIKSHVKNEK